MEGPLLDVPVPMVKDETGKMFDAPFPHLNDRESFLQHVPEMRAKSTARATNNLLKLVGKAVITGAIGYGGYLMWTSQLCGRF